MNRISIIRCFALALAMAATGCVAETTPTDTSDYEQVADSARRAEFVSAGKDQTVGSAKAEPGVVLQAHPASDTNGGPVPDPWISAGPVPDPWVPHARRQPSGGDPTTPTDTGSGSGGSNK
jgi:hypothetical protein